MNGEILRERRINPPEQAETFYCHACEIEKTEVEMYSQHYCVRCIKKFTDTFLTSPRTLQEEIICDAIAKGIEI